MTQFAYTPLEAPESSIRSLEVFPDEEDGPVKVQLSEHKTPLTDRYRCLSYMWGPPSDDAYNIIVNDCVFRVRNNLYHFLRMAGKRFPHTPLWIDAVCINQEDDTEKGIQVSRMSNIYAMAVETLIWLGDDAEVSSALEWLDTPPWDWSSNAAFASLEKLYVDPYWTRMWICQEILLSGSITVHTTHHQVTWEKIGVATESRPKKLASIFYIRQNSNPEYYWYMWLARHPINGRLQGNQPLWDLLTTLSTSGCTDQRDRIYGLLALVQNGSNFKVSYTEAPVDLFWRAGEHFGAWARPAYMDTLRLALNVDMPSLNASVEKYLAEQSLRVSRFFVADPRLSIELQYVRPSYLSGLFAPKALCVRKACKGHHKMASRTRGDITLCARTSPNEGIDIPCVHAILRHASLRSGQNGFTVTLIAATHAQYPEMSSTMLDPDALRYFTAFGWETVKDWKSIEDYIKRHKKGNHWRILVSPALIVEYLNALAAIVRLIHDEADDK